MTTTEVMPLAALYEADETAWLDAMSRLAAAGRHAEMDFPSLSEYLADMAKRDRREVFSRLVTLLMHLLKWEYQPERRTGSWQSTIMEQKREMRDILESGTLRNHATDVFAKAYDAARKQAAAETGLPRDSFPAECALDLEAVIADEE